MAIAKPSQEGINWGESNILVFLRVLANHTIITDLEDIGQMATNFNTGRACKKSASCHDKGISDIPGR
jgi:hypothetical protein